MKKKTDEKQLLAEAKLWFEQQHGKSPKECGIKFFKVWYKPIPFKKKTTVVFAPTEEAGNAFIWEQNAILRSIKYFGFVPIFLIAYFFTLFSQEPGESAAVVVILFAIPCIFALLLSLYLGWKCKKLEKIHKWKVVTYYP